MKKIVIPVLTVLVLFSLVYFSTPAFQPYLGRGLKMLTRESRRILGWEKSGIPSAEKRIREEVILKKMEEASAEQDWRSLAPDYPRPRKLESLPEKEKLKLFRESAEFKEMEKELKDYLKKKEDLFDLDLPAPSARGAIDPIRLKDKGAEKVIQGLLGPKEKTVPEKALEENVLLGIKGPLAARRILEKPNIPHVKVKVDIEIELTLYVLPNGTVDRVIPSVKGDADLERIAIQYLKQWRFAPLPKGQAQAEQWGTIPVKFKLQ
jgi:TonB family protein